MANGLSDEIFEHAHWGRGTRPAPDLPDRSPLPRELPTCISGDVRLRVFDQHNLHVSGSPVGGPAGRTSRMRSARSGSAEPMSVREEATPAVCDACPEASVRLSLRGHVEAVLSIHARVGARRLGHQEAHPPPET